MLAAQQLADSYKNLIANPLRSGLSIIGVVFGVGSVVAMLAIGMGAEAEIAALLDSLGVKNIHIMASDLSDEDWNTVSKSTIGLGERDSDLIAALYPESQTSRIATWQSRDVNHSLPESHLKVFGVSANTKKILDIKISAGRFFSDYEESKASNVCILGSDLAHLWFGSDTNALEKLVRVDGQWFRILGVAAGRIHHQKPKGTATANGNGPQQDNNPQANGPQIKQLGLYQGLIIPLVSAQKRFGPRDSMNSFDRLIVQVTSQADPLKVRNRIKEEMTRLHRGAKIVDIVAAEEVIAQKKNTTRLFSYFLMTIALISLVVGGIGIANVMLASMVERIKEVGLRRAIGAKKRDIFTQFLTEALAICLAGGFLGGVFGVGVGAIIGTVTGWHLVFPWWGMLVAVAIASLVGIGAGIYPALSAAKISPIEALQGRA